MIIVGARVAGSATAMLLARAGMKRWEPTTFIASDDITIAEARLVNPPENPRHCPPAVTMVHFTQAGRTRRMVCRYADR